jgi:RNA polymerase sigma factor (sigma-70 family)
MNTTSVTLLQRAQMGDPLAWRSIDKLYRPLIYRWLITWGLESNHAEDLTQDVMAVVIRKVPDFEHTGRPGSFRSWLRVVSVNRAKRFWLDKQGMLDVAEGGSGHLNYLADLEDPTSPASQNWDREHNEHILRQLLTLIETEFEPRTMEAFRRLVIAGEKPTAVADATGLSIASVYSAKSRILARLRSEAEEFYF